MENYYKTLALAMIAYAAVREVPANRLCAMAGIPAARLDGDRGTPLTADQLDRLWKAAVDLTGDRFFGLHFGESLQLAALGAAGQLVRNSATAGEALMTAAGLMPMLTPHFLMVVEGKDRETLISFQRAENATTDPDLLGQVLDFLMVFSIHELDGLLLHRIVPISVNRSGKYPDAAELARVFRCHPRFGTGTDQIVLDAGFRDFGLIGSDFSLREFLVQQAAVPAFPEESHSFKTRIYQYLRSNSYLGMVSMEDVAANFNMSHRSLQRRLKEEGSGFQQLADEVRKSLAIEFVRTDKHPLKEISWILGYNELSAFTRSFKRWTGSTPAFFRKNPVKKIS